MTPALLPQPASGMVHEHVPQHLRRHGQKMPTVAVDLPFGPDQPQIGLVRERGRLQRVVRRLSTQASLRQFLQLVIDEGQ